MGDGMPEYEYEGLEEKASPDQMKLLAVLAQKMEAAELLVDQKERELKEAQTAHRKLREHDLPELMLSLGMKKLTTQDGLDVKLREAVRAKWPEGGSEQVEAVRWLEEHGHGGLVKRQFIISFSRDDEKWANKFQADLLKRKKPLELQRKTEVHNSTLCAFLKEQLTEGKEVPMTMFKAFVQKFAEVKRGR